MSRSKAIVTVIDSLNELIVLDIKFTYSTVNPNLVDNILKEYTIAINEVHSDKRVVLAFKAIYDKDLCDRLVDNNCIVKQLYAGLGEYGQDDKLVLVTSVHDKYWVIDRFDSTLKYLP